MGLIEQASRERQRPEFFQSGGKDEGALPGLDEADQNCRGST